METLFVTGGSSTLGQQILRRLASRVHIVALMHRRNVAIPNAGMQVIRGGLEECVRQPAALQEAQIVLHMAAVTHTDDASEYLRVNTELTKQLLSVCNSGQHFVYVSTVCAHPAGGAYGRSKWLAEEAIRASGLNYTIVRPAEIYGSKGSEGIDALIAVARKTHILPDFRSGGSIKYAPISLDEAAQFIAEATLQRRYTGQIYTICAERPCTAVEMARALRSSVRPLLAVPVPVTLLRAAAALRLPVTFKRDQVDRLVLRKECCNTAARRDYGFRARPFLDYLAAGRLPPSPDA
jgi:nucleoside-diphosphate-sugar epimerase